MGHFFQLIKNYAETTLLIGKKIISQEASYTARQSLRRIKSATNCANCLKFVFKQRFWVLKSKNHIDCRLSAYFKFCGFVQRRTGFFEDSADFLHSEWLRKIS